MGHKRLAGLALVAGLAGGGVAGALFGAPGVSGAQEATTSTTIPAAPRADDGGPGGPAGGCAGRGPGIDAAATALGMSTDELHTQLRDGQTIAEVAKAQNVDVQKVIDAMVADANTRLDEAVASGRLTQAQADAKRADLKARITSLVNDGPPARPDPPAPPAGAPAPPA